MTGGVCSPGAMVWRRGPNGSAPSIIGGQSCAEQAGVHVTTVQRTENHDGRVRGTVSILEKVMNAFGTAETLGVSLNTVRTHVK